MAKTAEMIFKKILTNKDHPPTTQTRNGLNVALQQFDDSEGIF